MSRRGQSPFSAWFAAQFGALPMAPSRLAALEDRKRDLDHELTTLRNQIQRQYRLHADYRAASYAWNAATSKEKK